MIATATARRSDRDFTTEHWQNRRKETGLYQLRANLTSPRHRVGVFTISE